MRHFIHKLHATLYLFIFICYFSVLIDLVDMDGQVKNLSGRSKEYASEVVNGRETYVLIRVESE